MPFVQGFLHVVGGGSPDNSLPGVPGSPDQGLPGSQPGVDNSLPMPPPGVWPPPVPAHPIVPIPPSVWPKPPPGMIWPPSFGGRPDNSLPGQRPPRPDNSLPGAQPGPDNSLPGQPPSPDQGLPGQPPRPDQGLPGQPPAAGRPPRPDNSLPGDTTYWVLVWVPGYGYKYVVVDPSLSVDNSLPGSGAGGGRPDNSLPPAPARPDNSLPPTPQPKK
jgi:hypothetical protein